MIRTLLALAAASTVVTQATEVTFRYFRFTPTKNYLAPDNAVTQLSEFTFGLRGTILNVRGSTGAGPVVPMTPTGGSFAPDANEGIEKMFDGSVQTKLFSGDRGPFLFDFLTPVTIDSYNFATANDFNDRTPVSWTLEGSNDNANWVVVDARADVAITDLYRTFQTGWTISGGPLLPAFSSAFGLAAPAQTNPLTYAVSSPGIVKVGESTNLAWTVTGTNPAGTVLNPGGVVQGDAGPYTITPTAGTTAYTLAATNASGTSSNTIQVRAVTGGTATYQYFRFTPLSLRNNAGANSIQLAEFEFYNGGVKETAVPFVSNPGGNFPGGEPPSALVDNNPATKWLDFNKQGLVFDFPQPITIDGYQFVTAGDAPERDPVAWVIEGSEDLTNWVLVDAVGGGFPSYPTPTRRMTGTGVLPISGRTLLWKNDANGNWDTTTANFNPKPGDASTTAFGQGDPVRFADITGNTNVLLTGPVTPSHVAFANETTNYVLSGSSISGNTQFVKSGAGSVTLGAANAFTGGIFLNGGTVVADTAHSLGAAQSNTRLQLGGGSTLSIKAATVSQRHLEIVGDGATIDIDSGASLTKIGRSDFNGTLTKTGGGTLRFEAYMGSSAGALEDIIIEEGTVDFGQNYYANFIPYPTSSLNITVNPAGTLRLGASSSLGGHHTYTTTSIGQVRLIGGTMEVAEWLTYFPSGTVDDQGRVVLQGGLITGGATFEPVEGNADAVTTFSALASEIFSQIGGSGELALNPGNITLITEAGAVLEITRPVSGGYGILKQGEGELILTNANTYTGANPKTWTGDVGLGTNVVAGTLTLSNSTGSATGTSEIKIAAGAKLQGTGTATGAATVAGTIAPGDAFSPIDELTLGNTTLTGSLDIELSGDAADKLTVTGSLNITGATLNITGTPTASIYQIVSSTGPITGTFAANGVPAGYTLQYSQNAVVLTTGEAQGYEAWAAGLSDPSPEADIDNDGIANILEYLLNSNATVSSTADLPKVTKNAAGDLIFTFVRKSEAAYLNAVVEYSTTLADGSWTTVSGAQVATNTPSAGLDTVTATIPASAAAAGKVFARLRVETAIP
ncbi:autotransporter-associated beta strand repeat-containing protein [Luteolibacter flavescens]|uniref:Autotransporter-associated beta strand repeat-containing protein n=1 Tax=Luteolibacter flavescens TaxID=1859460 RepID=A0ABT3FT92_9BACT|nr:autotransporter-associated beta strand repeat-containing protein [Luteolibacter flavescens]MCW1886782.1 autotransporter-associated beta strand repeat-containing protein [Luteolibacter flavescens]